MVKLLDYYYLVLSRCYGKVGDKAPTTMTAFFWLNLMSFAILTDYNNILLQNLFYLVLVSIIGSLLIMIILYSRYNEKRTEALKEKYKRESRKSRCRGITWVIAYKVATIAFFVYALTTIAN